MKHAYLIIAHNNWWQLKELIKLLDYENNDIYVHVDKKSVDFKESDFDNIVSKSRIYFYQKYKIYWGSFSIVETEMYLFEKAHNVMKYDYYHVISGVDLVLKSQAEIENFFEKNKGYEFIEYQEKQLIENPEINRRTKYYHFLQNYRRRYKVKIFNTFFTFCERVLLVLQIIFRIDRRKKLDWKVKYGSEWVSITNDLVEELIRQKDKIRNVFKYTNASDELFVQTVAYNCGFKNKIYKTNDENMATNMRYVDWKRGNNGNPYTFKKEDIDLLKNSNMLFARKFSEKVDKEIIENLICSEKGEYL